MTKKILVFMGILLFSHISAFAAVTQNWVITSKNENGVPHYFINNTSPGPTIRAKIGDVLSVRIKNDTSAEFAIHWHGLSVPNSQDGVGGVTGPNIKSGSELVYQFPIKQTGTYWYHAHSLEEAEGVYGSIVLTQNEPEKDQTPSVLFSGELKKSAQEVLDELISGSEGEHHPMQRHEMSNHGEHSMPMMMNHFSDISYNKYLVNGSSKDLVVENAENTKETKLRLVNAYPDGFLNLVYSGGNFKVVASDGLPIKPITVNHLRMAMGETYDVILPTQPNNSSELVSFFMGEKGVYSKVIVGKGPLKKLTSYDENKYPSTEIYTKIQTITPSFLKRTRSLNPPRTYDLHLVGSHDTYTWGIDYNGKKLDQLDAKVGDRLIFNIMNNTSMPHPMHLHGFFFRVLNTGNILFKHTININPMQKISIEIDVDEEGKWLFHCHNLFHMARGMMMTINVQK